MSTNCGARIVTVEDPVQGATIQLAFLYPAHDPERTHRFEPYALDIALDAQVAGQALPLVVISHGNGGTPWAYRDLAKHIARSGFVVALPEHVGNSRNDNSLAGTAANLENRPRHILLTIDAAYTDSLLTTHLAPANVCVIGHSIGACTALSVAGGEPWAASHESPDHLPHRIPVKKDERVRSLILLMPATFWFGPESLRNVTVPIFIRTGEKDEITTAIHAQTVIRGVAVRSRVEHKAIPGAGHFSAMSKFPPTMIRPDFPPSQDPEGFDREALQPALFVDIVNFLERTLKPRMRHVPPSQTS